MYVLSTGSQFPVQVTSCNFIIVIIIHYYYYYHHHHHHHHYNVSVLQSFRLEVFRENAGNENVLEFVFYPA